MLITPIAARTCESFYDGRAHAPIGGRYLDVASPYTGAVVAKVAMSDERDVVRAVEAADRASRGWRETPIKERSQVLYRFRELVLANLDELSNLAALEAGKTIDEARAGIMKGIEVTEFALSLQNMDRGGVLEVSRGVTCEVRREPLGVVVGITPFNFPAMVPFWMFPIALTVGNSFILKPSEKVALTPTRLAELAKEAGYPDGVFSVVHGGREAVDALVAHPLVRAVGFVGSSPVARSVYEAATKQGKRALTLGGAKNPLIIVPDADRELTTQGVISSFTGCAGQRCMAASLLIGVGEVDGLVDAIATRAASLVLGRDMGAIIDAAALGRIRAAIDQAESMGAKILVDGRRATPPAGFERGQWIGPTIIDRVGADWPAATTEIFGPVISIVRVPNLEAALAIDHANRYGNATSVFTSSGAVARRVADASTSGMIGVNVGVPVPREPFSFGGTKDSKFGHGDITGEEGVAFWSNLKKVTTKWATQSDATWMS